MLQHQIRRFGFPIGIVVLVLLYMGFWAVMSLQITNTTDFDAFFLPSARIALAGHPFDIYQVRFDGNYPNANGPLSILPLTIMAALAQRLGILYDFTRCRMLVAAGFALFSLLLSREAVLSLDMLLKAPLRGVRRFLAFCVFALSPELWHSVLGYGHIEHPIMLWMMLAGVRSLMLGRSNRAGIFLGLALLTRSSAVLYLLPLTLLLLRGRDWWGAVRFVGCSALTLAVGLLPFALADRADLVYSLFTFRATLPVGGGSLWGITAPDTALANIGYHYDSIFVIGVSLVLTLAVLAWRRDMRLGSRGVYGLLALSGLCFPLLLKTLWPYYFLDAYMLLALWWLAQARGVRSWPARFRWAAGAILPLSAIALGQISEFGLTFYGEVIWSQNWSIAMTLLMLAVFALIIFYLWRDDRATSAKEDILEENASIPSHHLLTGLWELWNTGKSSSQAR